MLQKSATKTAVVTKGKTVFMMATSNDFSFDEGGALTLVFFCIRK